MLAEFMLTPDALLAALDGDREAFYALKGIFCPQQGVPVALLSRLGEDWEKSASAKICRIDKSRRHYATSFFGQLLDEASVVRPSIEIRDDNENGWISSALDSNSRVMFDGIVVSPSAKQQTGDETVLNDFFDKAFWERYRNPRPVARDLISQEPALRCVCAHSEWVTIRMPRIQSGDWDELATVKQIIELSNLPTGFRKSEIDLHVCLQGQRVSEERFLDGVQAELAHFVRRGVKIRISLWPKFINRELIAGNWGAQSSGEVLCRPLWYISMNHVAVGRGEAKEKDSGNTWSLLGRKDAFERHEELKRKSPITTLLLE